MVTLSLLVSVDSVLCDGEVVLSGSPGSVPGVRRQQELSGNDHVNNTKHYLFNYTKHLVSKIDDSHSSSEKPWICHRQ